MMKIKAFTVCALLMVAPYTVYANNSYAEITCQPNPLPTGYSWQVWEDDAWMGWQLAGSGTGSSSGIFTGDSHPYVSVFRPDGTAIWNRNNACSSQWTVDYPGGTAYYYGFNIIMQLPTTPGTPAASVSNNDVNLSWSGSDGGIVGATYEIYRNSTDSSAGASKIGTTDATSYSDTNRAAGAQYYWLKATNEFGTSSLSICATGCFFNVINSINPLSRSFTKAANGASVLVEADSIVGWIASTATPWITLNSAQTNGIGNGTVSYVVSANTTADSRIGEVNIGDKVHTVNQSGYDAEISPTDTNINFSARTCQVSVVVQAGVSWTSVSNASWIRVVSGQSGSGNGTTAYAVSANTNLETRVGTLRIAGQVHTVNQTGVPTIVSPASTNMPQAVGSFGFTVYALASTAWTATTNVNWLHFLTNPCGTGNVIMTAYVDSNPSYLQRTGIVEVSGARCTVVQQGVTNPVFSINPIYATAVSTGAFGYVAVSATPDSPWTSKSSNGWVIVATGTNGAGDGMVSYVVSVNNSIYARTGTVSFVAPKSNVTHTVVQAGHVGSLNPATQHFTANGGSASTELTINSMCSWTSVVSNAWIQITANKSGVGSRQIDYTVAQNNTVYGRTGVVQIAGQTLVVGQSARSAQIDLESLLFDTDGGMGEVNVTTEGSAYWETSNSCGWISIFQGATNSGNGKAVYIVSPYSVTLSQRTAILIIAGKRHFVTQIGYTATIDPDVRNVMAEGGLNTVTVNSPMGAAWQADASADWVTITGGQSGNTPGPVTYIVDLNPENVARVGAIYVAGKKHTINQSQWVGGDVLPYEWEQQHWPEDNSGGATNDSDGDGFSNWQEWFSGSDPTNSQSVFSFDGIASFEQTGERLVTWPSIEDRSYTLSFATELLNGAAFSVIQSNIAATPPVNMFTDSVPRGVGAPVFYRIGVGQ